MVVDAEPAEHREPDGPFSRPAASARPDPHFSEAKNDSAVALSAKAPSDRPRGTAEPARA